MGEFIKHKGEDEGYQYFSPSPTFHFPILKTINYCSSFNQKFEIEIRIETSEQAKEPSQTQIKTLHFILNNQAEILRSVFNFHERCIYPIYNKSIDIEEDELINNQSQISRVYGIKHIEIPNLEALDSSYFLIYFDFKHDDEHGLYFLFKDTSVIDFFGMGDKNYNTIDVYQNSFQTDNKVPLEISLYKVPFQLILKQTCHFEEEIKFPLEKGAYRISIRCNGEQYAVNFYTSTDLERYSLKQLLSMN